MKYKGNNDTIKYKQSQIILRPQRFVCAIFSEISKKEATGGVCDEKRRKTQSTEKREIKNKFYIVKSKTVGTEYHAAAAVDTDRDW